MPKELTQKQVEAITEPGLHRVARQLYLSIKPSPSISRNWVLRLTVNGKPTWRGLGSCKLVDFPEAKAKALQARSDIYHGKFDATPKRKGYAPTLATVAAKYVEDHESAWHFPRAGQAFLSRLAMHAVELMNLPVDAITPTHVKNAIYKVWTTQPQTGKKVRANIEQVLEWARVSKYRSGPNPAIWRGELQYLLPRLSKDGAKHHRAVPLTEIPDLAARLADLQSVSSKALLFTMLCAVRSGDTRRATWSEIDLPGKTWNIPKGRTKAKRPLRVPLSDAAVSLLRTLPPGESEYVFPNKLGKPLSDMALLMSIRGIMGMGMTVHGLRSSFKDWSTENGFPNEVSELALDHMFGDATRNAYARSDLFDARRKLMAAWANFVMKPPKPEIKPRNNGPFSGLVIRGQQSLLGSGNTVQGASSVIPPPGQRKPEGPEPTGF